MGSWFSSPESASNDDQPNRLAAASPNAIEAPTIEAPLAVEPPTIESSTVEASIGDEQPQPVDEMCPPLIEVPPYEQLSSWAQRDERLRNAFERREARSTINVDGHSGTTLRKGGLLD